MQRVGLGALWGLLTCSKLLVLTFLLGTNHTKALILDEALDCKSKQTTYDTYATIAETNPRYTKKKKRKESCGDQFLGQYNVLCC